MIKTSMYHFITITPMLPHGLEDNVQTFHGVDKNILDLHGPFLPPVTTQNLQTWFPLIWPHLPAAASPTHFGDPNACSCRDFPMPSLSVLSPLPSDPWTLGLPRTVPVWEVEKSQGPRQKNNKLNSFPGHVPGSSWPKALTSTLSHAEQ